MKPASITPPGRLAALALAAMLAGCSFIPPYQQPAAPVASQWPAPSGADPTDATRAAADLPWQDFVQDPALRELVELALQNNRDLRVAVQNIEQARAQYQIQRAAQLPALTGSLSEQRTVPNANADANGQPKVSSLYTLGVGISSWELDFFGRVAALKDVALSSYLATEEALKTTQMSLIANVITAGLQLKSDTELLGLAERTLATREQSLQLTQLRLDNGAATALDQQLAQSQVANAQAARAQQQRLRAQDINALTLLVGQPLPERLLPAVPAAAAPAPQPDLAQMASVPAPVAALPAFAPVPAGLPSDLLLRRPDIRAAEQQLIGANANIGAARANFFPRITLTASVGRVSTDLDGLLGSGGTGAWTFAPSISLPIFDGGRNQANLDVAKAGRAIAVAQYEKAIQSAFREVADALAGRATLMDQLDALQAQATAERERYRLTDLRYRNGVASHLDLLDAQRSLFSIEQALAQGQLAERSNEVLLYKALGGGWTETQTSASAR
ncbi:efflux transporter outer membrane subunit [Ottowia sp.]|uniref:efflux transporter outer membrane subunit n=1 Tax=Ottowia sp. TaxID=1898956 RepID=UPI00393BBE1B